MDITRLNFYRTAAPLLEAIANSHFIAFDLEFSGIASRPKGPELKNGNGGGKPTLQERYEETKAAAEKYQVLQVGLTCVEQDLDKNQYILRPYNLNLSPLLDDRLDVERTWMCQSGAFNFLMRNGFNVTAPLLEGVPYLSREERDLAQQRINEKLDTRLRIADIHPDPSDVEARQFLTRVRDDIQKWVAARASAKETPDGTDQVDDFLNICPVSKPSPGVLSNDSLTGYQKRLVHQLVRAEFPNLRTLSRQHFIQIVDYDKEREEKAALERRQRHQQLIWEQTGFRWAVEAMVGGDLSDIDVTWFKKVEEGKSKTNEEDAAAKAACKDLQERLKQKKTVLVGHNLFTDLVNFYKCFFGKLPQKATDFAHQIHELFPMIIDTKYLATFNQAASNQKSSLEDIYSELRGVNQPRVEMHSSHLKYQLLNSHHEAGYDSMLTAEIMIKLSAQLEAVGSYESEDCVMSDVESAATTTAPENIQPRKRKSSKIANFDEEQSSQTIAIGGLDATHARYCPPSDPLVDVQLDRMPSNYAEVPAPSAPIDWNDQLLEFFPPRSYSPSSRTSPYRRFPGKKRIPKDWSNNNAVASDNNGSVHFDETNVDRPTDLDVLCKTTNNQEISSRLNCLQPTQSTLKATAAQFVPQEVSSLENGNGFPNGMSPSPPKDALISLSEDEGVSRTSSRESSVDMYDEDNDNEEERDEPQPVMAPPFESDFWRVYGNKLRVYGTQEEIFELEN